MNPYFAKTRSSSYHKINSKSRTHTSYILPSNILYFASVSVWISFYLNALKYRNKICVPKYVPFMPCSSLQYQDLPAMKNINVLKSKCLRSVSVVSEIEVSSESDLFIRWYIIFFLTYQRLVSHCLEFRILESFSIYNELNFKININANTTRLH